MSIIINAKIKNQNAKMLLHFENFVFYIVILNFDI